MKKTISQFAASCVLALATASIPLVLTTNALAAEPTVQKFKRLKVFHPSTNTHVDLTYVLKTDDKGAITLEILEHYYMDPCYKGVAKGEEIADELAKIFRFTPSLGYCPKFGLGFDKEMSKGWLLNEKDGQLPTGKRLFQWVDDGKRAPMLVSGNEGM
jgi:hypothetical protein